MQARVSEAHDVARQYVIEKPGRPEMVVWVDPVLRELGPHTRYEARPGQGCPCGSRHVYMIVDEDPKFWANLDPDTEPAACAHCGHFVE